MKLEPNQTPNVNIFEETQNKKHERYTEFEGKQEAMDMMENVSGKYGGVGLVISGAVPNQGNEVAEGKEVDRILPQDPLDNDVGVIEDNKGVPAEADDDLFDDNDDALQKRIVEKKRKKSP